MKRIELPHRPLIRAVRVANEEQSVRHLPVHRYLRSKFRILEFDFEQAMEMIREMEPDRDLKMPVSEYRQLLRDQATRLKNRDDTLICDAYGRVHTPLTSLPKLLRSCLSVDGHPLVNLDIANSQPLMAGIVALQYYSSKDTATWFRQRVFSKTGSPYPRQRASRRRRDLGRLDLDMYLNLCERGAIYESLMGEGLSRTQVKRAFLTAMYGENHWKDKLKEELCRYYPSVTTMLSSLKRSDYRHAAHVMQNMEATLVINRICHQIRRQQGGIPLFTIHDSVVTTATNVDFVVSVMQNEFRRLGVCPTIHQEEC